MENHEVAVTVFATVQGVDARDAANRLERAVMNRMLWNGHGFTIPATDVPGGSETHVHQVIEAGAALTNGYLTPMVNNKARRESPHQ